MEKTREELVKQIDALRRKEVELCEKHYAMLATDPAKSDCEGQYVKALHVLRQAEFALEMFDVRTKAKARLMIRLFERAYDAEKTHAQSMINCVRTDADLAVDAMTDDEVCAVDW